MNEEDILKRVQEYFAQNQSVSRQYDPSQQKMWTDSPGLLQAIQAHLNSSIQPKQTNIWDQNQRTLQQILQQRNRKFQM